MALGDEEIGARLSLKGRREFSRDVDHARRDVDELGDEIDRTDRKAGTLGGTLGGLGRGFMTMGGLAVRGAAIMGGAAVAAGGAFVALGVQSATAYEQAEIAFTTMLGSAEEARSFMEDLEEFGKKTPFELPGLIAASQNLMAFGFEAEEALPMLEVLGDTASGLNMGTEGMGRMVRALGQMRAKGRATTEEMMQLTEVGVNGFQMIADHLNVDVAEAMDMVTKKEVDFATAQEALLGGMEEQFGGLMEKQSATIGGMWSNVQDAATQAARLMVTPFQGDIKNALQGVIVYLDRMVVYFEEDLPGAAANFREQIPNLLGAFQDRDAQGMAEVIDNMFGNTGKMVGPLRSVFNLLDDVATIVEDLLLPTFRDATNLLPAVVTPLGALRKALGFIADNAETLQPILTALLAGFLTFKTIMLTITVATWAWTAAQTALNVVMSLNPLGIIILLIAALVAAFVLAWKKSETFRDVVTDVWAKVWSAIRTAWDWLYANVFEPLKFYFTVLLPAAARMLWEAIQRRWNAIKDGVTGVKDWIVEKWNATVNFFRELPGRISEAVSGMWNGIKEAFRGVINWIIDAWNNLSFTIPAIDVPGPMNFEGATISTPNLPRLHSGGYVSGGGGAIIQPDEELVVLPTGASVIPTAEGSVPTRDVEGSSRGPTVVQLVVDRKVLAEAVFDETRDRVARR